METDPTPREPRIGDEIAEPEEKLETHSTDPKGASTPSIDAVQEKEDEKPPPERKSKLPSSLAWIPANLTWDRLKPVIRCSLTSWVALVFMILPGVARPLGQVSPISCSASWPWLIGVAIRLASSSSSVINLSSPPPRPTSDPYRHIATFLSPPYGPFLSVLERELYMVFFITVTWA